MVTTDPAALVADALRAKASEIYVLPERDGTRIHFKLAGATTERPRIPERDGQLLIDRFKAVCGMPVGRDRELVGETVMYAFGQRVRVKVETSPYRQVYERATVKIFGTR